MNEKLTKPRSPAADVRQLSAMERIDLLGRVEIARNRKVRSALPLSPGAAVAAQAGQDRDPIIDLAAREYIAAIASKDRMRRAGYGGLQPDSVTLAHLTRKHFPGLDPDRARRLEERIRAVAGEIAGNLPA